VAWRIADLAPLENGKLTLHALGCFFACSDDVESADAFSVQTSVLRETLKIGE
jgi:hypothetical protein